MGVYAIGPIYSPLWSLIHVFTLPANAGGVRDAGLNLGQEDPLETEMATHTSILAWEIPRTDEPGRLPCLGSQRVGHDLATKKQHLMNVYFSKHCA